MKYGQSVYPSINEAYCLFDILKSFLIILFVLGGNIVVNVDILLANILGVSEVKNVSHINQPIELRHSSSARD